jgi:site-specific DNA-methyltransferase (adenine-specific)
MGVIQLNTDKGDLVFDPFMGSGTCGVVCTMMNRNFIGVEIDDKYFKIAKKRIEESNTNLFDL